MKPKRGEIWLVEFEPQRGAEIQKTRPAVVSSISEIDNLPVRIVVPLRAFKTHHEKVSFFIPLSPDHKNRLIKKSTADCSQIKSFALERFVRKLGTATETQTKEISEAVGMCIGLSL
jgi:mRNA interferase MazF